MKKILLLIAIVTFSACDDLEFNDNNIDTSQHVNVLTKLTNGTVPTTYQYDSNGRLAGIVQQGGTSNGESYSPHTSAFTYNGAGKLSQIDYDYAGSTMPHNIRRYSYNPDGTMQSVSYFAVDDATLIETPVNRTDYTYTTNIVTGIYEDIASGERKKTVYTSDNGNVVKVEHYVIDADNPDGQLTQTENYSDFDDKKIAGESMPSEYHFPMVFKNNYTRISNESFENTFEYTYNPDGYPVKRTQEGLLSVTYDFVRL